MATELLLLLLHASVSLFVKDWCCVVVVEWDVVRTCNYFALARNVHRMQSFYQYVLNVVLHASVFPLSLEDRCCVVVVALDVLHTYLFALARNVHRKPICLSIVERLCCMLQLSHCFWCWRCSYVT